MVVHAFNLRTQETEAGELYEFKVSLECLVRSWPERNSEWGAIEKQSPRLKCQLPEWSVYIQWFVSLNYMKKKCSAKVCIMDWRDGSVFKCAQSIVMSSRIMIQELITSQESCVCFKLLQWAQMKITQACWPPTLLRRLKPRVQGKTVFSMNRTEGHRGRY